MTVGRAEDPVLREEGRRRENSGEGAGTRVERPCGYEAVLLETFSSWKMVGLVGTVCGLEFVETKAESLVTVGSGQRGCDLFFGCYIG